jgi:FKBP-type peptidyl-prolyl cis-trans isomerase SlyD
MHIADHCVASFHYTLTNDRGEVLDSSAGHRPMAYLHGAGNIVPGLEKAMAGRSAGEKFDVAVNPEEGYGAHDPKLVQVVPRRAFKGIRELKAGMRFQAEGSHGPKPVVVTKVLGDQVTIDGNHPLAGEKLHFTVEITEVRQASAEELAHGHVHGPGGHHH